MCDTCCCRFGFDVQVSAHKLCECMESVLPRLQEELQQLLQRQQQEGGDAGSKADNTMVLLHAAQQLRNLCRCLLTAAERLDRAHCHIGCDGSCDLCDSSNCVVGAAAAYGVLSGSGVTPQLAAAAATAFEVMSSTDCEVQLPFSSLRCLERIVRVLAVFLQLAAAGADSDRFKQAIGFTLYLVRQRKLTEGKCVSR